MDIGTLEVIIGGAAALVSAVGGILTVQMRSSSIQVRSSEAARVAQAKESESAQQKMMETVLTFATEIKKGTDQFVAIAPPNGGHAQTRDMLRDQKEAFKGFGSQLERLIANQEARTDVIESLMSKLSEERFCKYSNEDMKRLRQG